MKQNFKKRLVPTLLAAFATLFASSAMAGTATTTFQVTASVTPTCTVSATNIAFGAMTPAASGNATSTGTISSTCTKTTPYTLNINAGGSGSMTARTMAGATSGNNDKLAYNLYTDAGNANLWGDGTGSTKNVSSTGTGAAQTTTVYATLPLNQYITPDNYTDNLTVTLSY